MKSGRILFETWFRQIWEEKIVEGFDYFDLLNLWAPLGILPTDTLVESKVT